MILRVVVALVVHGGSTEFYSGDEIILYVV